jgi:membrane fusion protein, multidrug efflux system
MLGTGASRTQFSGKTHEARRRFLRRTDAEREARLVRICGLLAILIFSSGIGAASAQVPLPPLDTADKPIPVRGLVRSVHQAMISTELQARVASIARREGEAFRKGDVLIELDCRRQRAELASAEASLQEMKFTLDNNRVLRQAQAVGKHDLDISQARVNKAAAEAEALRVRIDQCQVVAPFDGHVSELAINTHETTQPGKPMIGLISQSAIEIDLIVPSEWLRQMRIGTKLGFLVDETRNRHVASIIRVGAAVDPLSQTVKITAVFDDKNSIVLPGMSGTAELAHHD